MSSLVMTPDALLLEHQEGEETQAGRLSVRWTRRPRAKANLTQTPGPPPLGGLAARAGRARGAAPAGGAARAGGAGAPAAARRNPGDITYTEAEVCCL
jgi:hypothetical protein